MIEFAPLAASAVALLTPLLGKAVDKGVEEVGKAAATGILGKLKDKLSHAGAKEALEDLSKQPTDADTQAALRRQLVKAMEADPVMGEFVKTWLGEATPQAAEIGINQTANAQGYNNTVIQISGSANAIRY
ncbi:MAG: hypothetical protein FD135_29 [Comamonadaceae bacterium]|nr:MAG: hypothetical protein FD135_29 [Comamonadaceae bacterium]